MRGGAEGEAEPRVDPLVPPVAEHDDQAAGGEGGGQPSQLAVVELHLVRVGLRLGVRVRVAARVNVWSYH